MNEEASVEMSRVEPVKASRTPVYLGMVLFLISEAFLFGALFATYYYLRAETKVWPPAGVRLDTWLASINTFILLSSSATIWWAGRAIRKGSENGLGIYLGLTIFLGITFLGITVYEWVHATFQPWSNAYGSTFFTLTGFHALHVFAGVVLMASMLARTLRHRFSSGNILPIEISSLYWHYVDFIWILVFTSIFIVG